MKVLHVITGLHAGGAEGMLVRLLGATKDEFDASVVSLMDRGAHGDTIERMGIPVHTLDLTRGLPDPIALIRLAALIRVARPDAIVSWMYHANFIAALASYLAPRAPAVWTVHHANLEQQFNSRRTIALAHWCARLSRRCAAIVYASESARALHEGIGYRADRGVVIPVGIDTEAFRPDPASRERMRAGWGVGADDFVFGLLARIDPLKNHAGFLRAAGLALRERPTLRFVMAGKGVDTDNAELRRQIAAGGLDGRVILLGHQADSATLLSGVDALVSSSHGEAFPTVLVEAMSCGRPCVATDAGDSRRIVGPHGRVVPTGDDRALADGMLWLAGRPPAEYAALCDRARRHAVEQFDLRSVAAAYSRVIRSCAAARKERRAG